MDAGKLDKKIEFWKLNIVPTAKGNDTNPELILSTWANVREDMSMSRIVQAGGIDLLGSTEFLIYHRNDFAPSKDLQIRYKGEKYIINSITPYRDKKDYWRIQTKLQK